MKNLNVRVGTIDKFFILMRRNGNINGEIGKYAERFFENPERYKQIKLVSEEESEDVLKIWNN